MKSTIVSGAERTNAASNMAKISFLFFFAMILVVSASPVFAQHDPIVTISPDIANCGTLGDTFAVNIANNISSADSIFEVRIYSGTIGITEFKCGSAPLGWTLSDYAGGSGLPDYGYCEYKTTYNNDSTVIKPGNSKDFTFDAVMWSEGCGSEFLISTLDNKRPTGEHKYSQPQVKIDCSIPNITKTVGEPKLPGTGFDWWVTTDTNIHLDASDNTQQCDLGLDYCQWRVNVDGVQGEWNVVNGPSSTLNWDLKFVGDSNHNLEVECYDKAGNKKVLTEMDKVDSTPPVTTKVVSDPKKINASGVEWIDTATTVTLNAVDPDPTNHQCNIGVDKTWYKDILPEGANSCLNPSQYCNADVSTPYNNPKTVACINEGQAYCDENWDNTENATWEECVENYVPGTCQVDPDWHLYDRKPINKDIEACHNLYYFSVDDLGNVEDTKVNCFFVDETAPYINKNNGNAIPGSGESAFTNENNTNGEFHWITTSMPITFTCDDRGVEGEVSNPSEGEKLNFKVSYGYNPDVTYLTQNYCTYYGGTMEDGYCAKAVDVETKQFVFKFLEESMHNLEYYCEDAVEKKSVTHVQYYKVENTPPTITTEIVGPQHYNETEGRMYIDGVTNISVTATDPQPHPIGGVTCDWDYEVIGGNKEGQGQIGQTSPFIVHFPEESQHVLTITCRDLLGNTNMTTQTYYVDKTKPVTTKTYTGPQYPNPITLQTYPRWINSQTSITLTVDDAGPHKSGIRETKYRVSLVDDSKCTNYDSCLGAQGSGDWLTYMASFNIVDQSCHLIEYYSVDNVNKIEETKKQCVYVDTTAPYANKTIGTPNVTKDGNTYITKQTSIKLKCTDPAPHPVDHSTLYYRYRNSTECSGLENANWNSWVNHTHDNTDADKTITFPEDSCHELEYYCKDSLGNEGVHEKEIDIVDTVAPTITTTIVGPSYGNCTDSAPLPGSQISATCTPTPPPPPRNCYIDGVTKIHVEAVDPTPHPVGEVKCDWSYTVRENGSAHGGQTGVLAPFDINFSEESTHDLTITCKDELNNSAIKYENYQVDKTPPTTNKTYSTPKYSNETSDWITSQTNITLTVNDTGIHKSGIKETKYRVTRLGVGDENNAPCLSNDVCQQQNGTGDFTLYTGTPFKIGETSCHLIEYYSVDNVNKTEIIKKQCVFVDNTAPLPNKIVGKPGKVLNNGTREYNFTYYPEVNGKCWNGQSDSIDCWKVTTLTPISLDCKDQLPHPVGHSKVWFKVDLDGNDTTRDYCIDSKYGIYGKFDEATGYCQIIEDEAPVEFYFGEESEHNFKYYCEDALGNTGPVDDEKFKVEGTAFNITLNKKWNLISVPFAMLDNSIAKAFEDVADTVDSVWAYDSITDTWSVYTPGPAPDTLNEMLPGNGYWVKSLDNDVLVIGGSLFSPAQTPSSKTVVKGWNLIGYWGTEGLLDPVYDGPHFQGKKAKCELYSIGDSMLDKPFASLWSYWEPYNPNLWIPFNSNTRMDSGAGYWLYTNQNGDFVVPTTCDLYD